MSPSSSPPRRRAGRRWRSRWRRPIRGNSDSFRPPRRVAKADGDEAAITEPCQRSPLRRERMLRGGRYSAETGGLDVRFCPCVGRDPALLPFLFFFCTTNLISDSV